MNTNITAEAAPLLEHSRVIATEPQHLYDLVTDVTRAPEWLPEVRSATWIDKGPHVAAGSRFEVRLRSRRRRTRVFEVVAAEPGRAFAFAEVSPTPRPVWHFSFGQEPGGSRLTLRVEAGGRPSGPAVPTRRRLLEAISLTAEGRSRVTQPQLGQAHTAEGPVDLSAMFVMHHGFRRDLRDFVAAVPATPLDAVDAWRALERRWTGMSTALHHHHRVEDDALWPPLLASVTAAGDEAGVRAIEAMTAEHAGIDPTVEACARGFRAMVTAPTREVRDRLAADLAAARTLLSDHLAHEETAALPLVQEHLSVAAWKDFEGAARKEYGLADIGFAVPWSVLEVPEDQFRIAYAHGGTLVRAILAVTRRRFLREHATAFRHLPTATGSAATPEAVGQCES